MVCMENINISMDEKLDEFNMVATLPTLITDQIQEGMPHSMVLGQLIEALPEKERQRICQRLETDLHLTFLNLSPQIQAQCLREMEQPFYVRIQLTSPPLPQKHGKINSGVRAARLQLEKRKHQDDNGWDILQQWIFTSKQHAAKGLYVLLKSIHEQEDKVWREYDQTQHKPYFGFYEDELRAEAINDPCIFSLEECQQMMRPPLCPIKVRVYSFSDVHSYTRKITIQFVPINAGKCIHENL
jgi:hypothetical protein